MWFSIEASPHASNIIIISRRRGKKKSKNHFDRSLVSLECCTRRTQYITVGSSGFRGERFAGGGGRKKKLLRVGHYVVITILDSDGGGVARCTIGHRQSRWADHEICALCRQQKSFRSEKRSTAVYNVPLSVSKTSPRGRFAGTRLAVILPMCPQRGAIKYVCGEKSRRVSILEIR